MEEAIRLTDAGWMDGWMDAAVSFFWGGVGRNASISSLSNFEISDWTTLASRRWNSGWADGASGPSGWIIPSQSQEKARLRPRLIFTCVAPVNGRLVSR